jgi:hypothetical protein
VIGGVCSSLWKIGRHQKTPLKSSETDPGAL